MERANTVKKLSITLMVLAMISVALTGPALAAEYRSIQITARDGEVLTPFEKSWAVIIGVNEYENLNKLEFAVNDAKAVEELLRKEFGFPAEQIISLYDGEATKKEILHQLGDVLPYKIGDKDRLFIYFAGHGETRLDNGYLLPVGFKQGEYRSGAVSMTELKDILKDIKAKQIYLVLDACYSGMFFTQRAAEVDKTHPRYLREITRRKARQAFTAGGKEPVSDGGYQGHSAFTGAFLEALKTGYADYNGDGIITASEITAYVQPKVAELADQMPESGSLPGSEGGEFVFVRVAAKNNSKSSLDARKIELARLQAEADRAEARARELEEQRKTAELEKQIAEAKKRKEEAEARAKQLAMAARVEPPLPAAGGDYTDPETGVAFAWVEGGCFDMGSANGDDDEKPVHEVCVEGFYLGMYEVTQAQWEKIMGANPSNFKSSDKPVENVSWNDVQDFIQKLNLKTGKIFRLPTEAEWEYAARGGKKSRGCKYAGSNDAGEVAWYWDNSGKQTHPVGQKTPNELGLYDMSGNVYEWVYDLYGNDYYQNSPKRNPVGPSTGSGRLDRGGCWGNLPWGVRSANRDSGGPGFRGSTLGFRLALRLRQD